MIAATAAILLFHTSSSFTGRIPWRTARSGLPPQISGIAMTADKARAINTIVLPLDSR
jgi:hypothetical protein